MMPGVAEHMSAEPSSTSGDTIATARATPAIATAMPHPSSPPVLPAGLTMIM